MIGLPDSQVHLWCCRTDLAGADLAARAALLSEDERLRAARFRDLRHSIAYTASHGWLRRVLGAYVGVAPQLLRFREGRFGKPALAGAGGSLPDFNLSHAGDLAIVAVSAGFPVGVDIEPVAPVDPALCLATLAPGEAAALAALPAALLDEAFACCWTRKEAYLKATGFGLNDALADFEVSVDPRLPAQLADVRGRPGEAALWRLVDLAPAPGYRGALAARRLGWSAVWMARRGVSADPAVTARPQLSA